MADYVGFSKRIVCSDRFFLLSKEAKLLYFTLGMNGRKKGEVIGARSIARANGLPADALDELINNKYILANEDGTITIIDWYENNGVGETAKKRNNYPYRKFRDAILIRDGFRCKRCGGRECLEVHHIKPFALYPDLRLDPTNAITLCHECHTRLHGWEKHEQ
ncbi:MAG: HNH endonuclease [Aeriscardovia sp.]|nr:HNH endonuclease [Aeriscardovia sp.]